MSSYLWMALVGLVAAFVAKLILPGKNPPNNILGTALIGICGSFVGAFLGQLLGFLQSGDYGGFLWAIVGSVVLLFIYGLLFKPKVKPMPVAPHATSAAPPPPPPAPPQS